MRKKRDKLNKDDEAMALMRLLIEEISQKDELPHKLHKMSKDKLSQGIIGLFTRLCAHGTMIAELQENLNRSSLDNVNVPISCKSSLPLPCKSCNVLLVEIENFKILGDKQLERHRRLFDKLSIDYDALKFKNEMLKSNVFIPCKSCIV